jgi:hypothetical protein
MGRRNEIPEESAPNQPGDILNGFPEELRFEQSFAALLKG